MRTSSRMLSFLLVAAVVVSAVAIVPGAGAVGTTRWVDINNGNNAGPGTEAAPFRTIEAALAVSASGDTVLVKPGVYGYNAEQDFPINLPAGVTLASTDGPDVTSIVAYDTHRTIDITDPITGTEVRGLTITTEGTRGGIHIERKSGTELEGWPLIKDCVVEGNGNASMDGGGIWMDGVSAAAAAPRIEDTVVRDNVAKDGGGVWAGNYSYPTFVRCDIEGNAAVSGGGILSGTLRGLRVSETTVAGNEASAYGGGMYVSASGAEIVFVLSTIADNTAVHKGGGVWLWGSNPILRACAITGNSSAEGGGVSFSYSSPTFENCLLAGNDAPSGGAGYGEFVAFNFYACTIADNTGTWAGIYPDDSTGYAEAYNCVFWGNGGTDIRNATAIEYCDTQDTDLAGDNNTGVANVIHVDPLFVEAGSDYRLSPGSPCIDAGDPGITLAEDFFGNERPQDGNSDGTAVPDMGYHEYVLPELIRTFGQDRYETAAEIILSRYTACDDAIIASGENYPDALAAAGLAGARNAVLLLVRKGSVPPVTADALKELGVDNITIVGGPAAVSDAVEAVLDADYAVDRVFGADRYETAVAIAGEVVALQGEYSGVAFLARGDAYPDALALSPLSFRGSMFEGGVPILLTRPGELPPATVAAVASLDVKRGFVAGGTAAVSDAAKTAFDALLVANGGAASTRWQGDDRYGTAVAVAEGGNANAYGWWNTVGVATGTNFPDALVGGVGLGSRNGLLLLTRPDALSAPTQEALEEHLPDIAIVEILGGSLAVSDGVKTAIEAVLGL